MHGAGGLTHGTDQQWHLHAARGGGQRLDAGGIRLAGGGMHHQHAADLPRSGQQRRRLGQTHRIACADIDDIPQNIGRGA